MRYDKLFVFIKEILNHSKLKQTFPRLMLTHNTSSTVVLYSHLQISGLFLARLGVGRVGDQRQRHLAVLDWHPVVQLVQHGAGGRVLGLLLAGASPSGRPVAQYHLHNGNITFRSQYQHY